MFKKNKPQPAAINSTSNIGTADRAEVNTLIGNSTTLQGDLHFTGVLKIDGTIQGNLLAESNDSVLILDDDGVIEGEVRVPNMIINGAINGNVFASEKIDLYPNAKITGDVHYNLLEMEVGAEVNGRMLRQEGQAFASGNQNDVAPLEESIESLETS
ncbi:MAG: polymer-forming cytoskeletal protein [Thiotrichaceae bacterium]